MSFNKTKVSVTLSSHAALNVTVSSCQNINVPKASTTCLGSKWVEEDIAQSDDNNYSEDDDNQSSFINDLFDKAEEKMITAVDSKYKKLEAQLDDSKNKKEKPERVGTKFYLGLSHFIR